ncbi:hypothetical protein DFH09DRAFT_1304180 [Mycena vulgaris]|nr:hypothetical protein DFH09DRAFT_1304180 [Mycena vulgaris]
MEGIKGHHTSADVPQSISSSCAAPMQFFTSILALGVSTAALASASVVNARQGQVGTIAANGLGFTVQYDGSTFPFGGYLATDKSVVIKDKNGKMMLTVTKN